MTWRQVLAAILMAPFIVALFSIVIVHVVWKLPTFCCERLKTVRHLFFLAACYYGSVFALLVAFSRLEWWHVGFFILIALIGGDVLLPNAFAYFGNVKRYKAVYRAIEFVESQPGPHVMYSMTDMIAVEADRRIVAVVINTWTRPLGCRFLAVGADGTVMELDFDYVSSVHGVEGWF